MANREDDTIANPTADLLIRWQNNCRRSQIANYAAASRYSKRNRCLGIPTIVLSTIVGTSVFATLESSVEPCVQILIGLISIASAVLAALQTFLRSGEMATKFKATAVEYGVIKREIDQILLSMTAKAAPADEIDLTSIREQMDTLSREAPDLPSDIWKKAQESVPLHSLSPQPNS